MAEKKSKMNDRFIGLAWGLASVALGAIVVKLIDFLQMLGDYLIQGLEWVIIFPAKIVQIINLKSPITYLVAGIIGFLLGPVVVLIFKFIFKLMKKQPV